MVGEVTVVEVDMVGVGVGVVTVGAVGVDMEIIVDRLSTMDAGNDHNSDSNRILVTV